MEMQEKKNVQGITKSSTKDEKQKPNLFAENALWIIAYVILIAGVILTVVYLYNSIANTYRGVNIEGFVQGIFILVGSIAVSATLIVLSNISISLKEINRKNNQIT